MAYRHKLTGRCRLRMQPPGLFTLTPALIVVQVELHQTGYELDMHGGTTPDADHLYWRDATLEDLSVVGPALADLGVQA
jgi:hypothetical protein